MKSGGQRFQPLDYMRDIVLGAEKQNLLHVLTVILGAQETFIFFNKWFPLPAHN